MAGRRVADHAEVEQRDAAVAGDEDVARMRIGVESPVDQHLLQVGAEELLGQRRAFQLEAGQRAERGDLAPFDVVHREHAARAVVRDRLRHLDQLEFREIFRRP